MNTVMSPQRIRLSGNGVTLEPLSPAHTDALIQAASDGELWNIKFTSIPNATSAASYIAEAQAGEQAGTVIAFAIVLAATNTVIGSTRFWKVDRKHRKCEIGFTWIAKSHQGTFVNPAIKYLMLRYAFETMGCVRVQLQTDELNAHSRAAIERLGAKLEGILRQERIMPDGRRRNTARYSIIESEWPEARAALEARLRTLGIEPAFTASS
jgi:N-acetyltransferase